MKQHFLSGETACAQLVSAHIKHRPTNIQTLTDARLTSHATNSVFDPDSVFDWTFTSLALQHRLGILSERRRRIDSANRDYFCFVGADLKR